MKERNCESHVRAHFSQRSRLMSELSMFVCVSLRERQMILVRACMVFSLYWRVYHTNTRLLRYTRMRAHTYILRHTYTPTYIHTYTHTHVYILRHTCMHTHTHTHMHTYIHTYINECLGPATAQSYLRSNCCHAGA